MKKDTGKPNVLCIRGGILVDFPLPKGDKNWLAKVDIKSGKNIGRKFIDRAGGSTKFLVHDLQVNDVVEFGADKLARNPFVLGNTDRTKNRSYGVITQKTETELHLTMFMSVDAAIACADQFPRLIGEEPEAVPVPWEVGQGKQLDKLREKRLKLLRELAEVEKEIAKFDPERGDENLI